MKIFITGATGYIGFAVAKAFRKHGYSVKGLVRSQDKSHLVAKEEIEPVIGNMSEPEAWIDQLTDCDTFIHAGFDMSGEGIQIDKRMVETLTQIARPTDRFIYTSGVWVYGNTLEAATEKTPLNPIHLVAWRPAHEEIALKAACKSIIIRPGCVYGKSGGLTQNWFKSAREDCILQIGNGKNHWSLVHVDDLAEGYVLAKENADFKEIYNLSDDSFYSIQEMMEAIQKLTGAYQIKTLSFEEAREEWGAYSEGFLIDQRISSDKAKKELGWKPKHPLFLQDLKIYYEAWRTSRL